MAFPSHQVGRAGEHLVAYFLSFIAENVFFTHPNSMADIVFEYKNKFYLVQVKTKSKMNKDRINWRYDIRKNYQRRNRTPEKDLIDIFAFVNTKYTSVIFSLPPKTSQITFLDDYMKNNDPIKNIKNLLEEIL